LAQRPLVNIAVFVRCGYLQIDGKRFRFLIRLLKEAASIKIFQVVNNTAIYENFLQFNKKMLDRYQGEETDFLITRRRGNFKVKHGLLKIS